MGTRGPIAAGRARKDAGRRPQPSKNAPDAVRREFRRIVAAAPWITAADAATVETMAEAVVLQREAIALLLPGRLLVVDKAHGNDVRRNPALIAWRTAAEMGRACAAKLGITPQDYARLGIREDNDEPSLADVLFGEVVKHGDI